MNQSTSALIAAAKQGFTELGYVGDLVQEDYAFVDFDMPRPRVRRIAMVAFGHIPTSFESAWIGLTVGTETAESLRRFRALGAPQILVIEGTVVGRWKMPATGDPILQERIPADRLLEVMRERQDVWGQPAVARVKTISFSSAPMQLDFYDAGLVPAIESVVRKKLDRLLSDTLARAIAAHQEHIAGDPDLPGLYRLVFRLLAAKLLEDRGHSDGWASGTASDVVARVEQYYYGSRSIPAAVTHPEVQDAAWRYLRSGVQLQNVSVSTLAYIYENTLVSRETRKEFSIHGTPPEIAEYIVRRLPFESLELDDRRVFEPFSGHAVFLIAALGRLRELLPPEQSNEERHEYFVSMLVGMEEEPFAIEVARLSLMLADYPNPNGWQLEQGDVFADATLRDRLMQSNVVLCNPPFEEFSGPDRAQYEDLRSTNQAADILNRVLDHPPPLLGFVLPRVFRDGQSFREARERLVRNYGVIEITELPDRVFAHSDVRTVLLLAYEPSNGHVDLRCSTVDRADLHQFLTTGEPSRTSLTRFSTDEAASMPALWRFPLERLWEALQGHPVLKDGADVHRGIEYRVPFREHRNHLLSDRQKRGFELGLVNVEDGFEPLYARPVHYVNLEPDLMLYKAYLLPWAKPKVVTSARRLSRGPWRLAAVADRQGLVLYQNFIGVWPIGDWNIEVISAVLNGYIANAFVDVREERDNRLRTIRAIPVPRFTPNQVDSITIMVREYERQRDQLTRSPSRDRLHQCKRLLDEINEVVLSAYSLPISIKSEVAEYFKRAHRPYPLLDEIEAEIESASTAQLPGAGALSADVATPIDAGAARILQSKPQLVDVVNEAVSQLRTHIQDGRFSLALLSDPDYGEDEQLILLIATDMEESEALASLQRFDREWWVHHVRDAEGLLCIDLSD